MFSSLCALLLSVALPRSIEESGVPSQAPELVTVDAMGGLVASPDGRLIVSCFGDRAWIIDPIRGHALMAIESHLVHQGDPWKGARFNENGSRLVLWSLRGTVAWVDVDERRLLWRSEMLAPSRFVRSLATPELGILAQEDRSTLTIRWLSDDGPENLLVHKIASSDSRQRHGAPFIMSPNGQQLFVATPREFLEIDMTGVPSARPASWIDARCEQLEISPDGEHILAISNDELLRFDAENHRARARRGLPPGSASILAIDSGLDLVLLHGQDQGLFALELADLRDRWLIPDCQFPRVEPKSGVVLIRKPDDDRVLVHALDSGELLWSIPQAAPFPLREPAGLGGEEFVIGGEGRNTLLRLEARTGDLVSEFELPIATARDLGMLTDDSAWVLTRGDRLLSIDAESGDELASRQLPSGTTGASTSHARVAVSTTAGRAHVFEGRELKELAVIPAGPRVELSRDGESLLTWGAGIQGALVLSLPAGKVTHHLTLPGSELRRAAWDIEGRIVAGVDTGGHPRLWNDGHPVEVPALNRVLSLAVDRDGHWLALGDDRRRVLVLDATSGKETASLELPKALISEVEVRSLAFDPSGKYLVATTGDSGTVQTWRCEDWEQIWCHDYAGGNPGTLQLAIDDGSEHLWVWGMMRSTPACFDLSTGEVIADLAERMMSDFDPSPDGETIAAWRNASLVLINVEGRELLTRIDLEGHGPAIGRRDGSVKMSSGVAEWIFVRRGDHLIRGDEL